LRMECVVGSKTTKVISIGDDTVAPQPLLIQALALIIPMAIKLVIN